jgi:hypothetical protein
MKPFFNRWLIAAFIVLPCYCVKANDKPEKLPADVESVLIAHQWTLVEALQTFDNAITDMTLLMMPCEKDNFVVYSKDGIYQVMEGVIKCNSSDNSIKVNGTWQFDASDTMLIERYGSGSKIAKKILVISNEVLKIQYVGEGKKIITLMYLSENGIKKDENKELITEEKEPAKKLMELIRDYISSTNHYVLADRKDLEAGKTLTFEDEGGAMPVVALVPFANAGTSTRRADRNSTLMASAKKAGVDYVITGWVDKAEAVSSMQGNFEGRVDFYVDVLNVSSEQVQSKYMSSQEVKPKKNKGINLGSITKAIANVSNSLGLSAVFFGQYQRLNQLYDYYFISSAVAATTYEAENIFGQVNKEQRKRNYDSTTTLINAAMEAAEELPEFISSQCQLIIKINRIEGSGKKATVVIEAGNNIRLKENELHKIVKVFSTSIGNKTVPEFRELGEVKVTKVVADVLSYCVVVKKGKEFEEAMSKTPGEVMIITTVQPGSK